MVKVRSPKVLLVGWDAADWKVIHPLMDEGKMPTVRRLVEEGAMANLATLHPVLSPMLWTSIATGKRPLKHGIHGFSEPTPDGTGIQPITNLSRKTKAIWNVLTQKGLVSNVVGWWPSHPAEPIRGVMVSNHFQRALGPPDRPWPTPPGSVHPERLTRTLADLRLNPNELLAEHIRPFIPQAAEIDQEKDRRLASCAKILAECTSVHAVATWLMENEPCDFMAVYYDAIDHFCHAFMRYYPPRQEHIREQDFHFYQGVVAAAYCYHDMMLQTLLQLAGPDTTVILISDHGFHPDHLRPRVLPAEPAGPAHEHRDFGILVIHGPGVKKDAILHGPNLLDITPTLLTLFGLPVGADMDGQPLLDAFENPPKFESIPSWDDVEGEDGRHPSDVQLDPVQSREAIQQLVALGYIEPPGPDREKAIARTVRELRYNLARSYMDADRYSEAAKILERLYDEWPDEQRFGVQLAMSYRAMDRIADLRSLVEDLTSRRKEDAERARAALRELLGSLRERRQKRSQPTAPKTAKNGPAPSDVAPPVNADEALAVESGAKNDQERLMSPEERRRLRTLRARAHYNPSAMDYLWSCVFLAEGDYERALECLRRSEQRDAQRPGLGLQIGEAYLKLRRPEDAELAFRNAAEIDPDNPHAQLGLCRTHLLRRQNRMAAEKALRTIGLLYHYPMAHYCLGVALHRMGRVLAAIDAFQIALSLNPNFAEAHDRLAKIFRNRLGDHDKAQEHRREARQMRASRRKALAAKGQYRPRSASNGPADGRSAVRPAAPDIDEERGKHDDTGRREGDGAPYVPKRRKANARQKPAAKTDDAASCIITVVSGLPRSGTSMVMQMLATGGMSMVSDGLRKADTSNLRGYYEDERVKKLRTDDTWLGEAQGMAIKIIAQLLPCLPPRYHYRILYIDRDMDEVMESQYAMLRCTDKEGSQINTEHLKQVFVAQTLQVKQWLARRQNIETLSLDHRTIIEDPTGAAQQICDFVPDALDANKMASAVDRSLYRRRK